MQVLIENILGQLPDEPLRNLKKLLEIYRELITVNNSHVELPEVVAKLKVWGENSGLRKVIGLIRKGLS